MSDSSPVENFKQAAPRRVSLMERITGRVPRAVAFAELRGLLATTPYEKIRKAAVDAVLAKSRMKPRGAASELIDIFEHAALWLASDHVLSEGDRAGLRNLQNAFDLTEQEAREAIDRAAGNIYERALREALSDGVFTGNEKRHVHSVAESLGLTKERSRQVYEAAAIAAVQASVNLAVADRKLTPGEDAQLEKLAGSLGVTMVSSDASREALERFRLLGHIHDGTLPELGVPIRLARGEVCHFAASNLIRKELRTITRRINYSGPTVRFKVIKGVYWRAGSMAVQRIAEDVLTPVDTVEAYLTSKRVLLIGARNNSTVPLARIARFTVFKDGLQIEKTSGRDVYLVGSADWELAGACLDAAIQRH